MEYQLKKQLSILIQLAKADDIFTEDEQKAIIRIGEKHGANENEIRYLFDDHGIEDSLAPMTMFQKSNFLLDIIMVLMADQEIHEKEEAFAKHIATCLGFQDKVVDFLLSYNNIDRDVAQEMMIPYLIEQPPAI
jgi:uncharacterized tellurite resistance protein B-like protein